MAGNSREKGSVGLEIEAFTIDDEGNMTEDVDKLYKVLGKDKNLSGKLREELSYSMIEMGSEPGTGMKELALKHFKDLKKVLDAAEKLGIHLLPIGCYPAESKPKMREKTWYKFQKAILDKNYFHYYMKICGFHFHYSIPKGVVGKKTEKIERVKHSETRDIFLNLYNFSVAAEAACITFLQSSPFVEGKHFAKDCRTLIYREMSIPGEFYGLYHQLPIFGELPHYEFTLEDLRDLASRRKNTYLDIMRSKNLPTNEIANHPDLKFMWGPIRVNKIGTLEFRGLDMNYPSYMFSAAILIEEAMDGIKDKELQMLPSDIGINEPFKIEDDTVYLPPFSIVKSIELLSTRYGFENSAVHNYCSKFVDFVTKISKTKDKKKFEKVKDMLKKKRTMSDEIISLVKKNNYELNNVPNDFLKYVATYYAKGFRKDMEETEKFFSSLKK